MNARATLSVPESGGKALAEALSRALDAGQPHLLLVLRLSDRREKVAADRVRLAQSLLEVASRPGGKVVPLGNGDLAVLMRRPSGGTDALSAGLTTRLARVFALPEAALSRMIACWPLDGPSGAALGYVRERLGEDQKRADVTGSPGPNPWDCLTREVAIRLPGPQEAPRLCVLHHALHADPAVLERAAEGDDPFLLRYLRGKLAAAVVPGLGQGALDQAAPAPVLMRLLASAPVHLALDGEAMGTADTARLLRLAAERGVPLGLDLPIADIVAMPAAFDAALSAARSCGLPVAVTGLGADHLALMEAASLRVDLWKLEASVALTALAPLVAALRHKVGAARLLLAGVESEAMVRWGMEQGIRRFQGSYVEAMLAAARMVACPHARGCTLAQCTERGTAVDARGRIGCRDEARLDRAA
jgi:hypothetical protein